MSNNAAAGSTMGSLVVAAALAGCDGSAPVAPRAQDAPPDVVLPQVAPFSSPSAARPAVATAEEAHGHFRGTATRGGATYHGEALVTEDGELRLYLGGPVPVANIESGAGLYSEALAPSESVQFVGHATAIGSELVASGIAIGQVCASASARLLCGEAAPADLRVTVEGWPTSAAWLRGELRVTSSGGELGWSVELASWSAWYRSGAASPGRMVGATHERLASFAQGDDVIVTIEASGQLFFQAPRSGCIGNGTLAPHGSGNYLVFDVELLVENCRTDHAYLNGVFTGLATSTQNNYWGYDDWPAIFVSTLDGAVSPAAMVMLGTNDGSPWDY